MRYIVRMLTSFLLDAHRHFPAAVLTGPRRAGKTTLLRRGKRVALVAPWMGEAQRGATVFRQSTFQGDAGDVTTK